MEVKGLVVTGLEGPPGLVINVLQTRRTPNLKEKSSVIERDVWLDHQPSWDTRPHAGPERMNQCG